MFNIICMLVKVFFGSYTKPNVEPQYSSTRLSQQQVNEVMGTVIDRAGKIGLQVTMVQRFAKPESVAPRNFDGIVIEKYSEHGRNSLVVHRIKKEGSQIVRNYAIWFNSMQDMRNVNQIV